MVLGTLFSLTFSKVNIYHSLWVGLISFIDADSIYKLFEGKIFKKFSDLKEYKVIERNDFDA